VLVDLVPELLPHTGDREEDRRSAREQVVRHGGEAPREPGLAAGADLAEVARDALGDVRERQERQEPVVRSDGTTVVRALSVKAIEACVIMVPLGGPVVPLV
jgi:hypothetical protein